MPTSPHGRTYLPLHRDERRHGVALCLSGGGFRAALFHLGAARRLYELGVLDQVETITAVSGGSLTAAHLAQHAHAWRGQALPPEKWEELIAAPFRAFTSRNLSAWPVMKGWLLWWTNAGVEELAKRVRERLPATLTLHELPRAPNFKFCASDLVTGNDWIFERTDDEMPFDEQLRSVATAVAVSSCHPAFFRPFTRAAPQHIALVDGGLDDNRGLEPVWRTHRTLIVSDGGDVLRPQWGQSLFWSLFRSAAVMWNQSQLVQKRWLLSNFVSRAMQGAYWGIDSSTAHYPDGPGAIDAYAVETMGETRQQQASSSAPLTSEMVAVLDRARRPSTPLPGYSPALARDVIATIRTDYDAFSAEEAAVLENHGYFLANAAARAHLTDVPQRPAPLRVPHPAWMGERQVREALRDSSKKRLFGRH